MLKRIVEFFQIQEPNEIHAEQLEEGFIPILNSDLRLNSFQRDKIQTIFLNIVFRYVLNDVFIIFNARVKECKEAVGLDEDELKLKNSQRDEIQHLLDIEKLKFQNSARITFESELKKATKLIIKKDYLHNNHQEDLKQFFDENKTLLTKLNQHLLLIRKKLLDKITTDLSENSDFIGGNANAMTEPFIDGFDDINFVDGKSVDKESKDKTKDSGSGKQKIRF
ncbi:hypothetical protein C7A11_26545 [Pseudomonas simiae]|uniref:hypothetical protein n=1 Tax=Pseudomonas simiae TaxID=321846 RepID=UPI000D02C28C|nr:hypothetical protein [Pseudomonas simiae]PRW84350.1 hypothetical protein C7A11_26545 [Pseudomonas simiae]